MRQRGRGRNRWSAWWLACVAALGVVLPAAAADEGAVVVLGGGARAGEPPRVELALAMDEEGRMPIVTAKGPGLIGLFDAALRCDTTRWTLTRLRVEGSAEDGSAAYEVPPALAREVMGRRRCSVRVGEIEASLTPADASTAWSPVAAPPRAERALVGRVLFVLDGVTIGVQLDGAVETVRYAGILPLVPSPDQPTVPGDLGAAGVNRLLVGDKAVRLDPDAGQRDPAGRRLAYVHVEDLLVNAEMVRRGYARVDLASPDTRHREALVHAEEEARRARSGLWAAAEDESEAGRRQGVAPLGRTICPASHPIKALNPAWGQETATYFPPRTVGFAGIVPDLCYATEGEAEQDGFRRARR